MWERSSVALDASGGKEQLLAGEAQPQADVSVACRVSGSQERLTQSPSSTWVPHLRLLGSTQGSWVLGQGTQNP